MTSRIVIEFLFENIPCIKNHPYTVAGIYLLLLLLFMGFYVFYLADEE